jgi:N-acetyl-alpha-D-muramate 1-phosphate uridylyltransferase
MIKFDYSKIVVVILAGGKATRLKHLTVNKPKSLIKIKNEYFIIIQLKILQKNGFKKVVVCCGHLAQQIKQKIKLYKFNMQIIFSNDGKNLVGTGGAIKKALKHLSENFIVIYGDVFFQLNFKKILNSFNKNKKKFESYMIIQKNNRKYENSNIQMLKNNEILYDKFITNENMEYIDYGVSIFKKKTFTKFKKKLFNLSEVQSNLSYKKKLYGWLSKKNSYEIGSFEGIRNLKELEIE